MSKLGVAVCCFVALVLGVIVAGNINNFRFEKAVAEKDALRKDLLYNINLVAETQDRFLNQDITVAKFQKRIEFLTALTEAYEKRDNFFQDNFDPNDFPEE